MHVNAVFRDVVTEIIRLAIDHTGLHATAGHPGCETSRVMIAPVIVGRQLALRVARPAKFTAPNYQRVVEHSTLLQVGDQRGASLVGFLTLRFDA